MSNLYELHSSRNIFAHAIITSSSFLLRRNSAISQARTFIEKKHLLSLGFVKCCFIKVINKQIFNRNKYLLQFY